MVSAQAKPGDLSQCRCSLCQKGSSWVLQKQNLGISANADAASAREALVGFYKSKTWGSLPMRVQLLFGFCPSRTQRLLSMRMQPLVAFVNSVCQKTQKLFDSMLMRSHSLGSRNEELIWVKVFDSQNYENPNQDTSQTN